ncbi:DUF805 domain-containing protein [Demequina aurantiaca]|uniref:DUF805 domain-containing protein n=1 Tax=Demequina aurantiaca TaxID=676200 RepID=UPI003D35092F
MNWFFRALGKYGVFRGRARRKEYWWFVIISWLLAAVLLAGFLATSGGAIVAVDGTWKFDDSQVTDAGLAFLVALAAISLILIVPHLAVTVRRLHDSGKSGGWVLLLLVLPIVVYILALLRGDSTANKHGPDPISTDA